MLLILEGPDGGGKTTLAEQLRNRLHNRQNPGLLHIVKHGPYKDVMAEDLCKIYFRAMSPALTFNDTVVMDRSWLSEPIYGEVYRKGANRIDVPRRRMLERVALSRGAVVVLCQPDFEVCCKTFESRRAEEYLDTSAQLRKVYDGYTALELQTALPVVHYDYTRDDIEDLMSRIDKATIHNEAAGGGAFMKGNTLLLCDKGPRANMRASAVVVPFVNFLEDAGPSRMLAMTLHNEGVSEKELYWINTQNSQGAATDPAFLKLLQPSKIYAIGNNAYTWALQHGVKAIKLPPPLYHMQHYPTQPYQITEAAHGNHNN